MKIGILSPLRFLSVAYSKKLVLANYARLSSLRTRIAVLWPQYFQHWFHKRTEFRTYFLNISRLVNEKWDYLTFNFSVSLIPWAEVQTDCSNEQSVTVSFLLSFFLHWTEGSFLFFYSSIIPYQRCSCCFWLLLRACMLPRLFAFFLLFFFVT